MTENAIDVDVGELDAREVPVPHHPWSTAKRVIREACTADSHARVELTGLDEPAYWCDCLLFSLAS